MVFTFGYKHITENGSLGNWLLYDFRHSGDMVRIYRERQVF
jgi:hypothetical protein